jgi:hypothetical protein
MGAGSKIRHLFSGQDEFPVSKPQHHDDGSVGADYSALRFSVQVRDKIHYRVYVDCGALLMAVRVSTIGYR